MNRVLMHHVGALLIAATVSPTVGTVTPSSQAIDETSRNIIVTAITTLGIVLVALITNYRRRESTPPHPAQPPTPSSATIDHEDSRQNERIAVVEYQVRDLSERMSGVERKLGLDREKGPGAHREE